jgi:hypothetical protein
MSQAGMKRPPLHRIGVMPARDHRAHWAWANRFIGAPSARSHSVRPVRGFAALQSEIIVRDNQDLDLPSLQCLTTDDCDLVIVVKGFV